MSVRRTDGPSWNKKVAPGKKEHIFSKTVSMAASVRINFLQ